MEHKINISEFSDFCFGVKRAISLAEKAIGKSSGEVFSLGPIIHNRQVVDKLSEKGLKVAGNMKEVERGTVVIRSHGVTTDVLDMAKEKSIDVVDATCPFVKQAQKLAKTLSGEGYKILIIGDKGHPEVKSLQSFSANKAIVVTGKDEARKLCLGSDKIGVIAQSTQLSKNFYEIIAELMKKEFREIRIFNTICTDTDMRQESTRKCSEDNDLVIVVGGKNSANTRRLYEICKKMGRKAYHVETGREIRKEWVKDKKTIGVVSGASTPRQAVDGVVERLKNIK